MPWAAALNESAVKSKFHDSISELCSVSVLKLHKIGRVVENIILNAAYGCINTIFEILSMISKFLEITIIFYFDKKIFEINTKLLILVTFKHFQ